MTKLTFSKKIKLFAIVTGILFTGGTLAAFIFCAIKDFHSFVPWAIMLPLFIFFTGISVICIREAFFSYCIFDDERGIEFYSGYSKIKKISVDSLKSFLPSSNGISISYTALKYNFPKIKTFIVSRYFKDLNLLYDWLDSHTRNIYAEEVTKSLEEFKNAHSELEDEEKGKLFIKNRKIAKLLNIAGLIIAILPVACLFFNKDYLKIAFGLCAAYPVLIIILLRFFKGEIRFNVKNTEIYPSILYAFLWCSVSLMVLACAYMDMIVDLPKQFFVVAVTAFAMYLLYYFCASVSEKKYGDAKGSKILNVVSVFFIFLLYAMGLTIHGNVLLDKSDPVLYESVIIDRHVSHGKNTDYYLKLSPWIDEKRESKQVSVGSKLYSKIQTGDNVYIKVYKGFLGIRWFKITKKELIDKSLQ